MRGACWIFPFEVTLAPCRGRDGPTLSGEGLGFSKVHSSPLSLLLSLGGNAGLCVGGGGELLTASGSFPGLGVQGHTIPSLHPPLEKKPSLEDFICSFLFGAASRVRAVMMEASGSVATCPFCPPNPALCLGPGVLEGSVSSQVVARPLVCHRVWPCICLLSCSSYRC